MKPTPTKQITLSKKLVETISALDAEIKQLQAQIKAKSESFANLVSGVCLNEDLNFQTEGIYFSDDFATIFVYDLPKDPATEIAEPPSESKPTKVKKLKS